MHSRAFSGGCSVVPVRMKSLCTAPAGAYESAPQASPRHFFCFVVALWLAIGFFAVPVLPARAAWENGWIENLQLAILVGGGVIALGRAIASWRQGAGPDVVALTVCLVPVWLLLAARELSWGAALLPPLSIGADGPEYSSSVLWYKPAVAPVAVALLVGAGCLFAWFRAERLVWAVLRAGHFPWIELCLGMAAALLSTYGEGHLLGMHVSPHWGHNAAVLEEWAEVAAYMALVLAQWQVLGWAPRSAAALARGSRGGGHRRNAR